MESEEDATPRQAKRQGCFCLGSPTMRSPPPKRKHSDQTHSIDLSNLTHLDFSLATLISVLSDKNQRKLFVQFLESRYMAECILLYAELEKYDRLGAEEHPALAEKIFERFLDPNSDSPDTVTLPIDLVNQVGERMQKKEYDFLFREVATEMLVLMSANALPDFLTNLHVPSLEECFSDKSRYLKLLSFAKKKGGGDADVEFVRAVLDYETAPEEERHDVGVALYKKRVAPNKHNDVAVVSAIALAAETKKWDVHTFDIAKKDALKRIMLDVYPRYCSEIAVRP